MITESNEMASSDKAGTQPDQGRKNGSFCLMADKIPARFILAALFFVAHIVLEITRGGFNFAIVVMVNSSSSVTPVNQTGTDQLCPTSGPGNVSTLNDQGELEWSESLKGILLGAFYYGYILTQVVGGVLEQKLGGKIVHGTSMVVGAALNALGPVASRASPWAMFAVRFCMGLVYGVLFPTLYGVWGRWAPSNERSKLLAYCYIGLPLGNVALFPLASTLAVELGWPAVFYIPGIFVAVWFLAWALLAYDSPKKHPRITEEEQQYIEGSIGMKTQQKPRVPWLKMLTSLPVWALIIGQFCSGWGIYLLLTQLPNYMKNVLGFNIQTNGLLSALPFIVAMVGMLSSGFVADYLIQGGKVPKVWVRRGFVLAGFGGMVICGLILANLRACDPVAAVALLCLLNFFNGLTVAGFRPVHMEFAPMFSGVTYSLANMVATLSGILAPLLVGFITDNDPLVIAWTKIFYIGAGIQGVGGIFCAVFMRTDVQPWAQGTDAGKLSIKDEIADRVELDTYRLKDHMIGNEYSEMPTKAIDELETKL